MTPKSSISQICRDAVLDLAEHWPFARPFVNSGRLSTAVSYPCGALTISDRDDWEGGVPPGSPALDGVHGGNWLLRALGDDWSLLSAEPVEDAPIKVLVIDDAALQRRYDLSEGAAYLIRPDQYVAARWKHFDCEDLEQVPWLG